MVGVVPGGVFGGGEGGSGLGEDVQKGCGVFEGRRGAHGGFVLLILIRVEGRSTVPEGGEMDGNVTRELITQDH